MAVPNKRDKALHKAREMVERFAPGFPVYWAHALDRLRQQIEATN